MCFLTHLQRILIRVGDLTGSKDGAGMCWNYSKWDIFCADVLEKFWLLLNIICLYFI